MIVVSLTLCFVASSSQVPNKKPQKADETGSDKRVSPVTVVNNCSPATQAEQKPNGSPDRGWPVWGNIPDTVLALVGIATFFAVWKQSIATAKSAKATEKSADAAHRGIVLEYRPRIVVRGIELDLGSISTEDEPTKVKYVVANVGGTKATIVGSNATAEHFEGPLPAIPPYTETRNDLGTFTLMAGEYKERALEKDSAEGLLMRVNDIIRKDYGVKPTRHFHFFGFIEYRDELGILRRTGFCRRYDSESQRWLVVDDPEYEYSD